MIARRSEPHLAAAAPKRVERWQRIVREATQQSRQVAPPEITQPKKLKDALTISGTRIVLSESEDEVMLRDVVKARDEVVLAIGPEGGWTDEELMQFREAGWISASLGNTILRAETAAISAVAVIVAEQA